MKKDSHQLKLTITLALDEKWANNLTPEELREYIKARLDYSLGFRGQVVRVGKLRQR